MGVRRWVVGIVGIAGCEFELDTAEIKDDLSEITDDIGDTLVDWVDCDVTDLAALAAADDLSDGCREFVLGLLPDPQTSWDGQLASLGADRAGQTVRIALHGTDGGPIDPGALAGASFVATGPGGSTPISEVRIDPIEVEAPDFLSASIVTDYSSSMRDDDLDLIAQMWGDLVTVLPLASEVEVLAFSDIVTERQAFTSDRDDLAAAVERDDDIDRDRTALFDGMGTGATHLAGRTRPGRLLVVATDGLENASATWTQPALQDFLDEEGIFVVMVGSLFSDVAVLRELTDGRGTFFYAADYATARTLFADYVDAVAEASVATLEDVPEDATVVEVTVAGVATAVPIPSAP